MHYLARGVYLGTNKSESEKKKKTFIFLGTLFVVIMFLSGVAAFGNNNVQSQSTTTVSSVRTVPVFGSANAIVLGYSDYAVVSLGTQNQTSLAAVNRTLLALERNGSVTAYFSSGPRSFEVNLGTMNAYALQQLFLSRLQTRNSIGVNATTYVLMPQTIIAYNNNAPVKIALSQLNYSISISPLPGVGSPLNVSVKALIALNGSVYQNQVVVTPG